MAVKFRLYSVCRSAALILLYPIIWKKCLPIMDIWNVDDVVLKIRVAILAQEDGIESAARFPLNMLGDLPDETKLAIENAPIGKCHRSNYGGSVFHRLKNSNRRAGIMLETGHCYVLENGVFGLHINDYHGHSMNICKLVGNRSFLISGKHLLN
ncbi:hypothetical protein MHB50_01740 [Siminovitchia sp. FSL H7-0308]|uniref:Uncharacterized protein n=1 Tax=Siminovitchia thermophila TaxID=1245522 RepID=A0ABS2R4I0_9BACI|nr:hypothetical protein [Siminovitchia thermophila]MBM7714079.1 hypothetical protein [Siminovitchia thermophila]